MDQQVLSELVQIKWGIVAILLCIALIIGYYLVAVAFRIKSGNTDALLQIRESYIAELSLHESKGEYEELLARSQEMVNQFPGDLLANWFFAIGSHKNNQLGAALSALGKIKQINSAWCAEMVDAKMEEIRGDMDGPKAQNG